MLWTSILICLPHGYVRSKGSHLPSSYGEMLRAVGSGQISRIRPFFSARIRFVEYGRNRKEVDKLNESVVVDRMLLGGVEAVHQTFTFIDGSKKLSVYDERFLKRFSSAINDALTGIRVVDKNFPPNSLNCKELDPVGNYIGIPEILLGFYFKYASSSYAVIEVNPATHKIKSLIFSSL